MKQKHEGFPPHDWQDIFVAFFRSLFLLAAREKRKVRAQKRKMTTAAATAVDVGKESRKHGIAVASDPIPNGASEGQVQRPVPVDFKLVQIPGEDDPSAFLRSLPNF